jgi:hypothetical protein
MTRSKVLSHLAAYEKAQERVGDRREGLRLAVVEWKASGASIVEIARTLGWSRQSVYALIGGK